MKLDSCGHPFKYLTGHPCCKLSALQCQQKCLRFGHMQENVHGYFETDDLINKLQDKKNQLERLPIFYTAQVQRIYNLQMKKLLSNKNAILRKIKNAGQKQTKRRSDNELYFNLLWEKFDFLTKKNFEKLTCSDIDQFLVQINENTFQNQVQVLVDEFKTGAIMEQINQQGVEEKNIQEELRNHYYTECRQMLTDLFKQNIKHLKNQYEDLRKQKKSLENQLDARTKQYNNINFELKLYKQSYSERNQEDNKCEEKPVEKKKKKQGGILDENKKQRIKQKKKFKEEEAMKNAKQQGVEISRPSNIESVVPNPFLKKSLFFGENLSQLRKEVEKPEVYQYEPCIKQPFINLQNSAPKQSQPTNKLAEMMNQKISLQKKDEIKKEDRNSMIYTPPSFGSTPSNRFAQNRNTCSYRTIRQNEKQLGFEDLEIPVINIIEEDEQNYSRDSHSRSFKKFTKN